MRALVRHHRAKGVCPCSAALRKGARPCSRSAASKGARRLDVGRVRGITGPRACACTCSCPWSAASSKDVCSCPSRQHRGPLQQHHGVGGSGQQGGCVLQRGSVALCGHRATAMSFVAPSSGAGAAWVRSAAWQLELRAQGSLWCAWPVRLLSRKPHLAYMFEGSGSARRTCWQRSSLHA